MGQAVTRLVQKGVSTGYFDKSIGCFFFAWKNYLVVLKQI